MGTSINIAKLFFFFFCTFSRVTQATAKFTRKLISGARPPQEAPWARRRNSFSHSHSSQEIVAATSRTHSCFSMHSPRPDKNTNPVTTKTGCQLNSAAPPSQAKPSLKCKTQVSTRATEAKPTATAAPSAARKSQKLSMATVKEARARLMSQQLRARGGCWEREREGGWRCPLSHVTLSWERLCAEDVL